MDQNFSTLTKIGNWVATLLLGNTRELIARIDERTILIQKDLDNLRGEVKDMKIKMDGVSVKVNDMSPKLEVLWNEKIAPAHSRRRLSAYGERVLKESGIKEIINEKREQLLDLVKAMGAKNAYDAERDVFFVAKELPKNYPDIINRLKAGAFNAGADLETVLFAGGIYLRDLIFTDLGFSL